MYPLFCSCCHNTRTTKYCEYETRVPFYSWETSALRIETCFSGRSEICLWSLKVTVCNASFLKLCGHFSTDLPWFSLDRKKLIGSIGRALRCHVSQHLDSCSQPWWLLWHLTIRLFLKIFPIWDILDDWLSGSTFHISWTTEVVYITNSNWISRFQMAEMKTNSNWPNPG